MAVIKKNGFFCILKGVIKSRHVRNAKNDSSVCDGILVSLPKTGRLFIYLVIYFELHIRREP